MSHTVTVAVKMTNREALMAAAQHLHLECLPERDHRIYSGTYHGMGFQLKDWNYPVIINPETGDAKYDNFGGNWGKQDMLDELVQRYGIEVARLEAEASGYCFSEERADNGDVVCTLEQFATT